MAGLYDEVLDRHRQKVEQALPSYLPDGEASLQKTVYQAMRYACTDGGKRLRPVLVMEFCRLCGGLSDKAIPFACAIEMIHSYSLVHDDLPCMDNSPLRRGKPSVHAAYGEDMALLAGDGLLTRAFEVMLAEENRQGLPPERALRAASALAEAAGAGGMVGGQVIDLQSEGKAIDLPTLEQLQRGKTAALITAACEMGCHIGGGSAKELEAARRFGQELGLCFQIIDDILDVTATPEELGKPVGGDRVNQKVTYVSLLGLEEAARLAAERTERAAEALAPFGKEAQPLRALAFALLDRTH
ncbi:MAG TPA: polyprenyl synthetase family protein [Firmicutes bacterium]|nr:polyprenyl synthetase family protein [Bacillota bacterium]